MRLQGNREKRRVGGEKGLSRMRKRVVDVNGWRVMPKLHYGPPIKLIKTRIELSCVDSGDTLNLMA